jgi:hypothetical protein
MHHDLHPCDVGIGLGSHDPAMTLASPSTSPSCSIAQCFHSSCLPARIHQRRSTDSPAAKPSTTGTTRSNSACRPRPSESNLRPPTPARTSRNIEFTRRMLADEGVDVRSILLISRPYQQRRAFATCKKLWPDVEPSAPLDHYRWTSTSQVSVTPSASSTCSWVTPSASPNTPNAASRSSRRCRRRCRTPISGLSTPDAPTGSSNSCSLKLPGPNTCWGRMGTMRDRIAV